MTTQNAAADRIRPFLRAMERSIDTARRERLGDRAPIDQPHGNGSNGETSVNNAHDAAPTPPQAARQTLDDHQIGTSRSFTQQDDGAEKVFRPRARPKAPSTPRSPQP